MNRDDLIDQVSKDAGITRVKAETVVKTIFEAMTEALLKGDRIEIRGFGSFIVKDHDGYNGRNPRTGEVIKVEPKKLPFFKVGKLLKEAVNGEI